MRLDLIVPARNEAANIQDALRRLTLVLSNFNLQSSIFSLQSSDSEHPSTSAEEHLDWRIVVVVNGTTDQTLERVEEYRESCARGTSAVGGNEGYRDKITAIRLTEAGKGIAIRHAARQSTADILGFIDADLSADPDMIPKLAEAVARGEADIAIGSRLLETKTTNRGWLRTLSSRFFNLMSWLILDLKVKDAQCGLKVMNAKARDLLVTCHETGWFLDIEFLAKAVQDGLQIAEVPVPWIEFRYAQRKSQIRYMRDGVEMLKAMWRIRRKS